MTDATNWVQRSKMSSEERAQTRPDGDFECIDCGGVNDQPQHWDMKRGQMWPEWASCVACMAPYHAELDRVAAEKAKES